MKFHLLRRQSEKLPLEDSKSSNFLLIGCRQRSRLVGQINLHLAKFLRLHRCCIMTRKLDAIRDRDWSLQSRNCWLLKFHSITELSTIVTTFYSSRSANATSTLTLAASAVNTSGWNPSSSCQWENVFTLSQWVRKAIIKSNCRWKLRNIFLLFPCHSPRRYDDEKLGETTPQRMGMRSFHIVKWPEHEITNMNSICLRARERKHKSEVLMS